MAEACKLAMNAIGVIAVIAQREREANGQDLELYSLSRFRR